MPCTWALGHIGTVSALKPLSAKETSLVNNFDQNPERELEQTELSKGFIDKASGKDTQRPLLEALLSGVREGGTVMEHSMGRLARNRDDLCRLVPKLTPPGCAHELAV